MPPGAENPPKEPSDLITLWQGTLGAYGFLAHALATARADSGIFIALATSLYVFTLPLGILIRYFQTLI